MSTTPAAAALVASVAAANAKAKANAAATHHHHRHINRNNRKLCACFHRPDIPSHHRFRYRLRVANNSKQATEATSSSGDKEVDKIVDEMDFGDLCNEFECISSPSVEATARQLARDILELREGNRALGTYAISVKYKDPVRSFTGREKYARPLWMTDALEKPTASVQEMTMLSTSVLIIKWTVRGRPKSPLAGITGDLIIGVTSQFTLNQISGQVVEHQEFWDLSTSSSLAQAFFWTSRRLFATIEAAKDLSDSVKDIRSKISTPKENVEIYPDPSGDPTKFFQSDDSFQRDAYQFALFLAIVYFVVQFLRITL